jgi:hypothetical protein
VLQPSSGRSAVGIFKPLCHSQERDREFEDNDGFQNKEGEERKARDILGYLCLSS